MHKSFSTSEPQKAVGMSSCFQLVLHKSLRYSCIAIVIGANKGIGLASGIESNL